MKKQNINYSGILFLMIPLTALALLVLKILSSYDISEGAAFVRYTDNYFLVLLGEYALISVFFIPYILKSKNNGELNLYILPLMLFTALGMMRIDADRMITSEEADHTPAIIFIILFISIIIMAFSGHTLTGTAGTAIGTVLFPAFGLAFSPYIAAAAFLFNDKNRKEKKISVILNTALSVAASVYSIIKADMVEFSFSKKYLPVLFLAAFLFVFFLLRKEYKLIPLALLPFFPLISGLLFGTFPTPLFTLSASVAPSVILLGTASLTDGNEKIKGYAQTLAHNPAFYIITAVFILHTACPLFVNPGFFRSVHK